MKRVQFLRDLRLLIPIYGFENIVYFDESGFKEHCARLHGWAPKGQKIFGDIAGNNRKTTNLIMAQRQQEWLAPMLFTGSCHAALVIDWIKNQLIPVLKKPSVIIMDNAPFHNKTAIKTLLEKHGHMLLPLPTYSPDFNPIEESFATIKKRRQFAPQGTTLDQLLIGNF